MASPIGQRPTYKDSDSYSNFWCAVTNRGNVKVIERWPRESIRREITAAPIHLGGGAPRSQRVCHSAELVHLAAGHQ